MQPSERGSGQSYFDCRGLGSTVEGSIPLRNPFGSNSPMMQRSSDQHSNLKPKPNKRKHVSADMEGLVEIPGTSSNPPTFAAASTVYSDFQKLSFLSSDALRDDKDPFKIDWKPVGKKSKVSSPQKNTLFNHQFTKSCSVRKAKPYEKEEDIQYICTVKKESDQITTEASGQKTESRECSAGRHIKSQSLSCSSSSKAQPSTTTSSQKSGSDPYGLFGLTDLEDWQLDGDFDDSCSDENTEEDVLSEMPENILEEIFALLPLTDLLLNVAPVCSRFRDIIQNPKYLLWKKRYHGLKAKRKEDVALLNRTMKDLDMEDIQNVLPNLPKCLQKFRRSSHTRDEEMQKYLKLHHKYLWSVRFIKEQLPDSFSPYSEDPDPWSVVGAIVALSDSVMDVSKLVQLLSRSPCAMQDFIEALYCLATLLYAAVTTHKALYGPHYFVFYALYLFENEWQAKVSHLQSSFCPKGQQSILRYSEGDCNVRMTHEQMRIINHPLQDKQVIKVVAFAGTGKTSTLVQFAKLRQGLKFLLIVYNKAAQTHASRVFPGNVECRTINSLAFVEGPGHKFKKKLTPKLRPLDIMNYLEQNVRMDRNTYSRHVLTALERFMASSDPYLTLAHVDPGRIAHDEEPLTDEIALCVVRDAEVIWKKMSDPYDWEVRALHDTYLKLYQLEKPVWQNYSCIMIDEAQDCTPAMLDIVLSQKFPRILVGDPNQQIYVFRGAVNALASVESTHTYYLTQSFRFGPEIAYVAHCTLAVLKNVTDKTMVGGKQKSSFTGRHEGQIAIIARGNSTLFNEAVRLLCKGSSKPHEPRTSEIRAAFVGGLSSYNLRQLVDIYNLMKRTGDIKDRFIARFKTFQGLQLYAKKVKDQELQGKVNLVLYHEDKITEYVQTITEKCKYDLKFANVVFTTAHKAKGLEFDTVCLADDFTMGVGNGPPAFIVMKLHTQTSSASAEQSAEYNILYVALTRAKKCLLLSDSLYYILQAAQENFEVPVLLESEQETCVNCNNSLISETSATSFVLFKKPLTKMTGAISGSGLWCKDCAGPQDIKDLNSGFLLKDQNRHAYLKILGTEVKEPDIFPFDVLDLAFLDDM